MALGSQIETPEQIEQTAPRLGSALAFLASHPQEWETPAWPAPSSNLPAPALQQAWVEFLEEHGPWEWFATFTFRCACERRRGRFTEEHARVCRGDCVHPEAADKRFRVLLSQMNRELHGRRWYAKGLGIQAVRAMEEQRRGVIHFHALMRQVGPLRRLSWMDRWDELAGYARIEPPKHADAVRSYVAKYTSKGGEIDVVGVWADELVHGPTFPFPPRGTGEVLGAAPAALWGSP